MKINCFLHFFIKINRNLRKLNLSFYNFLQKLIKILFFCFLKKLFYLNFENQLNFKIFTIFYKIFEKNWRFDFYINKCKLILIYIN